MKKGQLIINIVLLAGLAVLFALNFTQGSGTEKEVRLSTKADTLAAMSNIAFINTDSVISNYDKAIDINAEIESKFKTAQAELTSKQNQFMKEVQQLQYDVQRGLITRSDAMKKEEDLRMEEQEMIQRSNILSEELAEEQGVAYRKVYDAIKVYIEKYNETKGYTYVLGNAYGSNIYYAEKSMDITEEILEGLNAEYAKEKK